MDRQRGIQMAKYDTRKSPDREAGLSRILAPWQGFHGVYALCPDAGCRIKPAPRRCSPLAPSAAAPHVTHYALPAALWLGRPVARGLCLAVAGDALLHLLVDLPHAKTAGAFEFIGIGLVCHEVSCFRLHWMQCNGIGRCGQLVAATTSGFPALKTAVPRSSPEKSYEEIDMLFETKDD
jgi:hypothetical protein